MYGPLSQFSTKESLKFDAHWSVHANKMTLSCDVCSLPLQAKQANTKSSKFISIYIFSVRMSTMNFYRLYKILTDHNGCIEWCKEHNLLASSVKCSRAGCSNALSWTVRPIFIARRERVAMLEEGLQWNGINTPELMVFW